MFILISLLVALLIVINLPSKKKVKSMSWSDHFRSDWTDKIEV